MKRLLFIVLPLYAGVTFAQPPEPRKAPKPVAPLITLEQAGALIGEPTRITLRLKDATPQAVVAELSKQSNIPIRLQVFGGAERNKPLVIEIENQPFWTALREVCTRLQVQPQPYGQDGALMLTPNASGLARGAEIALSPLVTLRLSSIQHTHTLSFGNEAGHIKAASARHSMPLAGALLFDPKLSPLPNTMRMTVTEAVDEKGLALAEDTPYAYNQIPLMANLQIPLGWREDMGKKLVRLRAAVTCFVVSRREVWEVPDVMNAKNISKTVVGPEGEETYTIVSVQKVGAQYQVRVRVTRAPVLVAPEIAPEGRQLLYVRRDLGRMARLLDDQGRAYRSMSSGGGSQEMMLLTFGEFPGEGVTLGAPQKLVLDIPLEFRQLQIPIELNDIPLP